MPEMNENVSSGADNGVEGNGGAKEAAALLRTAATALLSAAEIWSTNPTVTAAPVLKAKTDAAATSVTTTPAATTPIAAPAVVETAEAIAPVIVETPDAQSPEQAASGRRLLPSEVL